MPNIEEVRSVYSHEDIREKEGYHTFSKRVLNALEEMTANNSNMEARIKRIENNTRYIQDAKKMQRCSAFMRNTVDKI